MNNFNLSLYLRCVKILIIVIKLAERGAREDSCQPHVLGLIFAEESSVNCEECILFMRDRREEDALDA